MTEPDQTQPPAPAIVRRYANPPGGASEPEQAPTPAGIPLAEYLQQQGSAQETAADKTPRWRFKIPAKARDRRDPKRDPYFVVLRELTVNEYIEISRQAGGNASITLAAVKRSLHAYCDDGKFQALDAEDRSIPLKRVNHAMFEDTALVSKWSPRIYALLQTAWSELHQTSNEVDADFLGSMAAD